MIVLIWSLVIISLVALYFRRVYTTFSKHGVKQLRVFPFLGNTGMIVLRQEHFVDNIDRFYKGFPNERFVGRYEFINPVLIVRDIELIKKIAVKDFEYFLDHRQILNDEVDPLFGRNLFALKGEEWKDMRSTLSPAFTSSKMKLMLPFMVEVGEQMVKALKKKVEQSGTEYIDIDCKDLTTRFANDVIATCAFGLKVDSVTDEQNSFYAMGKAASTFNFRQLLKFLCFTSFPTLMKIFKISLFTEETKDFFRELVMSTMRDREAKHIIRPDMIHLLMEAKKGNLLHEDTAITGADAGFAVVEESALGKKKINRAWSNDDLTAQAILFFIAGFETVSTAMSFLLHELAVNPDVQDRLVQEIREFDAKTGGNFDYNAIQSLEYMDMVVSEVLRLWTPAIALDRMCIKDYNMGKPNNEAKEDFILRKGSGLAIPAWSIHRDPQFFPNPSKFDPERFSEKNKHNIKPFTYIPFGLGPRNCIGSRFALCEVKVMVYQLLLNMEVSPSEKTCIPVKLSKDTFNMLIEGGHWVRLSVRN